MSFWIQKVVRRREVVGGLGLSALLLLFPSLAVAAGPTLKAARVGQKVVFRGYVYTVVKSKGKLVWKQGAKVATASASASAKPSASATPTPTPTASASPTPTETPTPTQTPSATPTPTNSDGAFVANSSEIKEGQVKIIEVNTAKNQYPSFSFSRLGGKVYAVSIICTHAGCKVVAEKTELVCNCHLSIFSPFDGAPQSGPARLPLTRYEVTERDGKIYIKP
jgi:nitrite reductase/ring-hydroxylating ferredoxin subunit